MEITMTKHFNQDFQLLFVRAFDAAVVTPYFKFYDFNFHEGLDYDDAATLIKGEVLYHNYSELVFL